jgi:hypothetical protein
MGILDNFEAWVTFNDEEETPVNDGLALNMFKEEVCNNCGCEDESNSKDLLSPEDSR